MNKYLITGGAGFIGSNFIKLLYRTEDSYIVNIDKLTYAGSTENLRFIEGHGNYCFIQEDISREHEMDSIFNMYKPDCVINFAAESHVDRSIEDSGEFVRTNVLGTEVLLKTSVKHNIKRYVQISTDEVYGSIENGSFKENCKLSPGNPYAASKAAGDLLVEAYHNTFNIPTIITRCTNNYGPNQHHEKLIPKVINKCINGEKISLYGDGLNVRDWIYVEDHCRAIYEILMKGRIGEIYNISANDERKNIEVISLIIEKVKEVLEKDEISMELIEYVADRKGHDKRYSIDASKLKKSVNWSPVMDFNRGIIKTIEFYANKNKVIRQMREKK